MPNKLIGNITHYYDKIGVAVLAVTAPVKVGDNIQIGEDGIGFTQAIESMQVEHTQINKATKGSEVGLKVVQPVKKGDKVYKVEE